MAKYRKLNRPPEDTDKSVKNKIVDAVSSIFPIDGNFYRIEADNIKVSDSKSNIADVKKALINGSSVMSKIDADVKLIDKKTGKVVDSKRKTIMRVPDYTDKESFVVEGNSYVIPYQQRLRPGVYTLKKRNGEINSMFNLAKGRNFVQKIDKNGIFRVKIGTSHVSLYSLLHDAGVEDKEIEKAWGKELLAENKKTYSPADSLKFIKSFYYGSKDVAGEDIKKMLNSALNEAKVDRNVVKNTLGVDKENADKELVLAASKKLLNVFRGDEEQDDRENMMFKQVIAPEDMLHEAFIKKSKDEINKMKFKLSNPDTGKVEDVMGSGSAMLTRPIKSFLSSAKASRLSEEYNPLMMHTATHFISPMGEGGVVDMRALNLDTKAVHQSQLGFIDPIVSPEGASVGVTLAVTGNSYIDETGAPAMKVINAKTGKEEIKTVSELWNSKVAYPISKERVKHDGVMVRYKNEDIKAKTKKDVDYIIPETGAMFAPSANMVAMMGSSDANRANMAQKHMQQALSLTDRDIPNVSVKVGGKDYAETFNKDSRHLPYSPVDGTVTKIEDGNIYIKSGKETHRVGIAENMPLARKTFIHHDTNVKVGDKVKKGQRLADSNYTKDGHLSLGKNIRTAWLSMPGNRNDGLIISESASEMMTSEHMYKETVNVGAGEILDIKRFQTLFPKIVAKWGATNYDARGIIKKGSTVKYGQPLVLKLAKTDSKQIKSRLERVMHKPYKAIIDTWHHSDDGVVTDVSGGGGGVRITVKTKSKAKIGDKLSGRHGNKGVITKIIPDDQMPKSKDGEPVHLLMTSAGVISRTNAGSLLEAGLGKITEKTKKRYVLEHYEKPDNLKFLEDEAKKHKVDMYETLINPETGKPFPQKVFVGNPYIMKLFKDSESGSSAVGVGGTDINEQPLKGGDESAASYSNMEVNALLAHDAKDLLREAKQIKGQRNDKFFDAFRNGMPLPRPADNFASEKFKAYLEQMNVRVDEDKKTKEYSVVPLTDKEVEKRSSGAIKTAETVYAKDGRIVKGGLFDEKIFGGPSGTRTGHINIGKKILSPLYKDNIAALLGTTSKEIVNRIETEGSESIKKDVDKIDVEKRLKELEHESKTTKNPQLINKNIKTIKMLRKMKSMGGRISDYAFISKVPVIPPVYRPISKNSEGEISVNDLNMHYQDIHTIADTLKMSNKLDKKTRLELEKDMFSAVGAMYGTEESTDKKMKDKGVKGILGILGGDTPKQSYAQKNMLRVKQFMSGRGVIKPARTDIGIDEIEIPEKLGLKIYEPHISRKLARSGYKPVQVKEMIDEKNPKVMHALREVGKEVPVVYNRAPSLWRHNILGGYPKFIKGDTIGVNPLTERSMNSDYDGDAISVHVPVTQKAIDDVKNKMLPSKNLFTDQSNHVNPDILLLPDQDATLGVYKSSLGAGSKTVKRVKDIRELERKISSGDINYNDMVEIK
jgi:DNA-directed RNA polymerase subunit beta